MGRLKTKIIFFFLNYLKREKFSDQRVFIFCVCSVIFSQSEGFGYFTVQIVEYINLYGIYNGHYDLCIVVRDRECQVGSNNIYTGYDTDRTRSENKYNHGAFIGIPRP